MKRALIIIFFAIGLVFHLCSSASAFGIGIYGLGGSGEGEVDAETPAGYGTGRTSFDVDTSHGGIGFMIDSAPDGNKLFNYRISLGLEGLELEDETGYSPDIGSFVVDQDFGFGFVKNPRMRIWAGPEFRLSWSSGEFEHTPYDIRLFGVGLGPAVGVNIHLSKRASLAIKGGFMHIEYSGKIKDDSTNTKYDVDVSEDMAFISIGILFRSGSKVQTEPKKQASPPRAGEPI